MAVILGILQSRYLLSDPILTPVDPGQINLAYLLPDLGPQCHDLKPTQNIAGYPILSIISYFYIKVIFCYDD